MKYVFFLVFAISLTSVFGQNTPITVGGDLNKYYPIVFSDNNWNQNKPLFWK
jgi:hypothetical protein